MRETLMLRFLYKTVFGRIILKISVKPAVSKAAGCFLSSGVSKWIIPFFIRKNKIDMTGVEIPEGGFSSFNAFFTRKRRTGLDKSKENCLISPCDAFLSVEKIEENTIFNVKNTKFSLEDLLKDKGLAQKFYNGTALIFRLTPENYHRYCYPADGKIVHIRKVKGKLHCVRPIALRTVPVFAQNSREYQVLKTDNFGFVIQMEIGALLVGKITNYRHSLEAAYVSAGEEKGYFEFGGSTIILLVQNGTIELNKEVYARMDNNGETIIKMGDAVAYKK